MTEINKNNLPVLYTIPRWIVMISIPRKYSLCYVQGYGYVSSIRLKFISLKYENRTVQEWYDRWILNITVPSQRPKCEVDGCSNEVEFLGLDVNYKKGSCSDKFHKKIVANSHKSRKFTEEQLNYRSSKIKEAFSNDPSIQEKKSNSLKNTYKKRPELREQKRQQGLDRYKDPYERLKTSLATKEAANKPESRNKRRKSQLKRYEDIEARKVTGLASKRAWANPTEKMRLNCLGSSTSFGIRSKIFSIWENKEIKFDSNWELKFYNSLVNRIDITSVLREPIRVPYMKHGESDYSSYYPDFLVNDVFLIEIKPNKDLFLENNQLKFKAAIDYCNENGLEYVIITEDYLFHNGSPYYGSLPFKLNDHATTND